MTVLPNLKATHLRALLTQIGAKSSGTKPQTLARLQRELSRESPVSQHSRAPQDLRTQRILSIDMGIKNLAFCVAEHSPPPASKERLIPPPLQMHITSWRRISLLQAPKIATANPEIAPEDVDADDDAEPFAPKALSMTAYTLVKDILLPHKPTAILIERQRFRSANQPAVQEWTLRVNLLEGMIWAVLRGLGYRDGVLPRVDVESVLPARVANFWVAVRSGGKGRVEKDDKVRVVKHWLEEESGEGEGEGEVCLSFAEEAEGTRGAFLEKVNGGRRRKRVVPTVVADEGVRELEREDVGKVDDLADCLLQAAAWAKWRENRDFLRGIWGDEERVREFAERRSSR